MKTLLEQVAAEKRKKGKKVLEIALNLEHQVYSRVPGTSNTYRRNSEHTHTLTLRHAHVYAKQNGGKKKLFSVGLDDGGQDWHVIPSEHADFFRGNGYDVRLNNTLEILAVNRLIDNEKYSILLLNDAVTRGGQTE